MNDIFLRNATKEDAVFLLDLANDSECRKNSLNHESITFENHMKWLEKVLNSNLQKQYILVDELQSIGQGRLESIENACRISYSIIPEKRGRGYGKKLIQLLNNSMIEDFPNCVYSYGEVLKSNISSQKIFEELGYIKEERKECFIYQKQIR